MTGEQLKNLVPKWAERVGVRTARLELQRLGLGYSTIEMLRKGEYRSTPNAETCDKLKLAMKDFLAELAAS